MPFDQIGGRSRSYGVCFPSPHKIVSGLPLERPEKTKIGQRAGRHFSRIRRPIGIEDSNDMRVHLVGNGGKPMVIASEKSVSLRS